LGITEDVVGFNNRSQIPLESADKADELKTHFAAQYNFNKYRNATDWQATVTVLS